ncbi:ABC transporter permease [Rhodococcus erythropolis]
MAIKPATEEGAVDTAKVDATTPPPQLSDARRVSTVRLRLPDTIKTSLSFIAFIVVFVVYAFWLGASFASGQQRLLDVHQNVPLLLIALGIAICMAAGQFDLSVGSMATLTCYLTVGLVVNQQWPFWLVLVIVVGVGLAGGLLNSFLTIVIGVNPFIATLGVGAVLSGLSQVYSGGTQISPGINGPTLPTWFSGIGSVGSFQTKVPLTLTWVLLVLVMIAVTLVLLERRGGSTWSLIAIGALDIALVVAGGVFHSFLREMSWLVVFVILVGLVAWVALRYTTYGRHLYATGGNSAAARLAGVHVERVRVSAFVASGILSSIAGIVLVSVQGSASPEIGAGFLLPAFAAAFLSTVLLSSGRFHVWGTLIGAIFVVWVGQGLVVGGVPFTWGSVISGVVLVTAVSLSSLLKRGDRRVQ